MQLPLFTIITSRITGARIQVAQVLGDLIIGKLMGFKRYPPSQVRRAYDGTKIIHNRNAIPCQEK
jgi:hypothetical protein